MGEIQRGNQTQQQIAIIPPQYADQRRSTVGATPITITFIRSTEAILVKNTHATQNLYVFMRSEEGAWNAEYTSIAAGGQLNWNMRTDAIQIQGSGAGTNYEIFATLE